MGLVFGRWKPKSEESHHLSKSNVIEKIHHPADLAGLFALYDIACPKFDLKVRDFATPALKIAQFSRSIEENIHGNQKFDDPLPQLR